MRSILALLIVVAQLPGIAIGSASLCDDQRVRTSELGGTRQSGCFWLGIGGSMTRSEYPEQRETRGIPLVHLDHALWFVRSDRVGLVLAGRERSVGYLAMAAELAITESGYDAANELELRGLDERSPTLEAGIAILAAGRWGTLDAEFLVDLEGVHDGILSTTRYAYPFELGALTVAPTLTLAVQDSDRAQYYYGIDRRQASEAGRPVHDIDQPTFRVGLGWSMHFRWTTRWMLVHDLMVERADNTIDKSPLTRDQTVLKLGIGLLRRFF